MTEQEYDDEIAPALAELAEKITSMGGSIVARVEWEKDEAGITYMGVTDKSGVAQRMAGIAALCRGNLDAFYIECAKSFDLSRTMVGRMMSPPKEAHRG